MFYLTICSLLLVGMFGPVYFLEGKMGYSFSFYLMYLLPKLNNQWLGRKEMFYLTMHLTISALLLYQYILWNCVIFHIHTDISEA